MSGHYSVRVTCDAPGCTAEYSGEGLHPPMPPRWIHVRGRYEGPIRDYCPDHQTAAASRRAS